MTYMKSPITINRVPLKNRLIMPPMATSKTADGEVNEELIAYYREKSAGGYIGLIITEHSYVALSGKAAAGQMSIARDSDVDGLKRLVDIIHQNDTRAMAQISHAGSAASIKVTGTKPLSASAVINRGMVGKSGEMPEEMTKDQIKQTVEAFAAAAARAKEAGYDGVEIHSAHGYLLNQFYSPLTNKRKDQYGVLTMEDRLRIHKEIIQAIRAEVGTDYLLAVRLGGCDYTDGGSTIEDSVEAAVLLESYGVDMIDISGGMNGYIIPGSSEPGYFSGMSEKIKQKISIPLVLTGGITDIAGAEKLLEEKKADLIGVGRAILRDSSWAKRMMGN